MTKKLLLAVLVLFVTWSVLDFLIHGMILRSTYQETPELWRPMEEMKMGLMYVVTAVYAAAFVGIYAFLIQPKSLAAGLKYGLLFGLAAGISMGYGSYSVMPIPYHLALGWFLAVLIEMVAGGLLVGTIMKEAAIEQTE